MSRTADFDKAIRRVTQDRFKDYGHPLDGFMCAALIKDAVAPCPHPAVRHALEQIGVKMSRLCSDPSHSDSVHDIAGYARCISMILDEEEKRNGQAK